MKEALRIKGIVLIIAGILVALAFFISDSTTEEVVVPTVSIGEASYTVRVAATPILRTKGLSGTLEMAQDEGMLFIFPNSEVRTFWMKDMHFPLDMVWIDENHTVVHITTNATPASYEKEIPDTFSSVKPAMYVLEIHAFETSKHNIHVGDKVELLIK